MSRAALSDVVVASDLHSPVAPPPHGQQERASWVRLFGASKALAIARSMAAQGGIGVLVVPDTNAALQFGTEVAFFEPALEILHLPDWETLPYDTFSPYQDIISDRISLLTRLPQTRSGLLILSAATLLHRLPPVSWMCGQSFQLVKGQQLDREAFHLRLEQTAYRHVSQVMEHGDYAIRGSIIDVFAMGAANPFRIDLLDEEIESLRYFDAETQRSTAEVESIELLPAREFPLTPDGIAEFKRNWRLAFEGIATNAPVFRDVSAGLAPAGIEYFLPLFFPTTGSVFDYLPTDATWFVDEGVELAVDKFVTAVAERHESLRHDVERPILPPERIFLGWDEVESALEATARIDVSGLDMAEGIEAVRFGTRAGPRLPVNARAPEPLEQLRRYVEAWAGRALFVAESDGRRETIRETFAANNIRLKDFEDWATFLADDAPLGLAVSPLSEGFEVVEPHVTVITESQLFGERVTQARRRRRSATDPDAIIKNLTELAEGAPVVHEDHGVGRYQGLETLTVGGIKNEFIKLEYADGDKLYVPVSSLHVISRYSGIDPEHAPLHKLGSGQWEKAKRKAAEKIHDVAAELLEVQARRAARERRSFAVDGDQYAAFAQAFPFEETPDQEAAIKAVLADMKRPQPMERLVCGDVGFGKTEVAMRAAFVAVNDGRQVGVLVPTTLLAQQHYQTFRDRFADWPVRIEELSRFRDPGEVRDALRGLESGKVDIVIGTHKLLGREVKFKRLGLLVIDEEHRFGVRQKERLKALRTEVDILTLTATPIPRTLNMALSGIRELSIIATPPSKRLAIKTFLREWNDGLIREALLREIGRGGQVYFVHNKVEDIDKVADQVAKIVPEARVQVAHGQMREKALERVMSDFYHRRCNVLVCTTIIETGIDVPSANTMIINRADRFGLAQLYQLRGRVGRSHHRAYAYLLVPHRKSMTADAIKRLEAIESLEDLGVGFTLATHDMEIRGAGEILGQEQSGQIQEIGFGLYNEMLNRAVRALKSGKEPMLDRPLDHGAEIDLHIPALLPDDYIPDVQTRLGIYKRISAAKDRNELIGVREEVIDRFGQFATPVWNLFRVTELKLNVEPLGVRRIDLGGQGGRIEFTQHPNIDPLAVIKLVQSDSDYRMDGQTCLRVRKPLADENARFKLLDELFSIISETEQPRA